MARKKWALSKELAEIGSTFYDKLSMEIEDLEGDYEDMSETWKDGDKGQAVKDWIDQARSVLDTMEEFESEPETV